MAKEPDKGAFGPDDVEVLQNALDLIPDLPAVAYAAKLARARLRFPVKSHDELRGIFAGRPSIRFRDRVAAVKHVDRFLPREFFPIASERDLMCKLLVAFQIGANTHAAETAAKAKRVSHEGMIRLPTPGPQAYIAK